MSIALIVIYNHQYNKNIDVIEELYSRRFRFIYHLVPFYRGNKTNVIPVYESSIYFQGYVAQAFKYFHRPDLDHYLFIGDDLLLNPKINEDNYTEYFNLDSSSSFIPGFISLHESVNWWERAKEATAFSLKKIGLEIDNQLPDVSTATRIFKNHSLPVRPLKFHNLYREVSVSSSISSWWRYCIYQFNRLRHQRSDFPLSYPLVGSYSDIFIVNAESMELFCHYCGVFAAAELFVELALPTSLVLSCTNIVTERELIGQGKLLWFKEDYKYLDKFEYSLARLLIDFPDNIFYIHPIKLSKWKML